MLSGRLAVILSAFAIVCRAAGSASLAGPVAGFVFDAQSRAIRPVLGIPGAASLGPPAASGLDDASVAPDGSAALAIRDSRLVLYAGLRNASPAPVVIGSAITGIDHIAWSADAKAAAIYSSKTRLGQMLSGLPQTVIAGPIVDLSGLPGAVLSLACDSQSLIAAAASGGIYLARPRAEIERIAPASNPSAMALAGPDLYFADNQSQEIWRIKAYASVPAVSVFAGGSGVRAPAGLQVSGDGRRLYLADAAGRKLTAYDIASGVPVQDLDLDFTPTRLDLFGDPSVFLLNSSTDGPLFVLSDSDRSKIAIYFVPAARRRSPQRIPVRPL